MPRYFFDLSDCEADREGVELETLECARGQAVVAAGDHLRDIGHDACDPIDAGQWWISVRDEAGTVLLHFVYSIFAETPPRLKH